MQKHVEKGIYATRGFILMRMNVHLKTYRLYLLASVVNVLYSLLPWSLATRTLR